MRVLTSALVLTLAGGCAPPDFPGDTGSQHTSSAPTATTHSVPPTLELGAGEYVHEPLGAGDPVEISLGANGGAYFVVSGGVWGLGEIVWVAAWVDRASDGARLGESVGSVLRLADYDGDTDCGWFAGQRPFLDDWLPDAMCPLDGSEVDLCATATALVDDARSVSACMRVVAGVAPDSMHWCATP